mgnify:CR=1 FL=1
MSVRHTLRDLVESKQGVVVPGAFDGVSARLVERAGFPAVTMTGYGTSASRLGLPDLGYAGLAEMADHARNLAAAVTIPLIADADTGYGNALGVRRTVQAYEAAGVAGLHIEDQVAPKRCGHLSGHQIVPLGEFAGKIRAARGRPARPRSADHRADGRDLRGGLRRGAAPGRGGGARPEPTCSSSRRRCDEAQVERVARAFDTPLLYNYASGGRSPLLPFTAAPRARLRDHHPADRHPAGGHEGHGQLPERATARDDAQALADRLLPFGEFNAMIRGDGPDGAGGPLPAVVRCVSGWGAVVMAPTP